ncbi:unnamed protein product [Rangifer tarandus platyrhynchus]|uniref:Uncharacterized protein n=1 Tax=Rangifer tarandus platyrhynchus TaxID=3082113 RepID=A0ABN9A2X6_RANTA|nr:unnamed protein product [Rangifer tarandus platyrhynchus]
MTKNTSVSGLKHSIGQLPIVRIERNSQASASLFFLLRGSCQPNSASCFRGSHLIHSPPDSPRGHQHLPREAALPEGSPEAISPASPCRKLEEQEQFPGAFPIPLLSACAPPSKTRNELAKWRSALPGDQPSINNQLHANLLELKVRRAHLHGTPHPSMHTDAGSTDSRKQGQDPKEKTPSVCLETSTRSPEDPVGGAGLHLELMFTKQPFVSLGEMRLPLTKCTNL